MNRAAVFLALALCSAAAPAAVICRIVSGAAIAFGTYDILSPAANDSQTSVLVTCERDGGPQHITVTMALEQGAYGGSINDRRMVNGTNPGQYLSYGLYRDSGRTNVWGFSSGVNTESRPLSVPNKESASVTFIIYGRVPAQQDVAVGSYTDVVQVTVTP